jgi:hypothetical protein
MCGSLAITAVCKGGACAEAQDRPTCSPPLTRSAGVRQKDAIYAPSLPFVSKAISLNASDRRGRSCRRLKAACSTPRRNQGTRNGPVSRGLRARSQGIVGKWAHDRLFFSGCAVGGEPSESVPGQSRSFDRAPQSRTSRTASATPIETLVR